MLQSHWSCPRWKWWQHDSRFEFWIFGRNFRGSRLLPNHLLTKMIWNMKIITQKHGKWCWIWSGVPFYSNMHDIPHCNVYLSLKKSQLQLLLRENEVAISLLLHMCLSSAAVRESDFNVYWHRHSSDEAKLHEDCAGCRCRRNIYENVISRNRSSLEKSQHHEIQSEVHQ